LINLLPERTDTMSMTRDRLHSVERIREQKEREAREELARAGQEAELARLRVERIADTLHDSAAAGCAALRACSDAAYSRTKQVLDSARAELASAIEVLEGHNLQYARAHRDAEAVRTLLQTREAQRARRSAWRAEHIAEELLRKR